MSFTKSQLNQRNDQLIKEIESRLDSAIKNSQRIGIKYCKIDTDQSKESINSILPYLRKDYSGVFICVEYYPADQRDIRQGFTRISLDWS